MTELLNFIIDHEEAFKSRGRLASLYSDFSVQRHSNPDNYTANISAWRKALSDAARAGLIPSPSSTNDLFLIRTSEDLSRALQSREYGRPLALGSVVADAVAKREWISLAEFQSLKGSIYQKGWGVSPWGVVRWGLKQLGVVGEEGGENKLMVGSFVVIANLEDAANAVLNELSTTSTSGPSLIFSLSTFTTRFSHVLGEEKSLSPTDVSLLLTHLSRDRNVLAYSPKTQTIKFRSPSSNATTPITITQEDETIASLNTLIESLQSQTSQLAAKIETLDIDARTAVAKKQTTAAKAALRSKKLAEKALEQRTTTLTQLEEVYSKIEAAADQVEIIRVMQTSASVLKGLHTQVGGVENVERVVERLNEEMGKVDEVSNIINEVGADQRVIADAEVDEEMEALEREEREKKEAAGRMVKERGEEAKRKQLMELETPKEAPEEREVEAAVERERREIEDLHVEGS